VWRATVGAAIFGFIFGGLAGFVVGFVEGVMRVPHDTLLQSTRLAGGIAGIIAGTIWGMFAVRMALRKRYSDFRLALIAEN
jgi:LytS/YehU family sensor histidine kinase